MIGLLTGDSTINITNVATPCWTFVILAVVLPVYSGCTTESRSCKPSPQYDTHTPHRIHTSGFGH